MNELNRRQWLRTAGLAGALATLGGFRNVEIPGESRPAALVNGAARMNFNENPYGHSKKVRQAMIDHFDEVCRYPFSFQRELLSRIAAKHGVPEDHVIITAGSTEGLRISGLIHGMDERFEPRRCAFAGGDLVQIAVRDRHVPTTDAQGADDCPADTI